MSDPHDHFFKSVFSDPVFARHLVRAVVACGGGPPASVGTLVPHATETVDTKLRSRRADIVFVEAGDDGPAYIHLEHQSRPDPEIALRMCSYQSRLWEGWRRGGEPLPAPGILSVIVYNGVRPWLPPTLEETCVSRPGRPQSTVEFQWVDVRELRTHSAVADGLLRVVLDAMFVGTRRHLPIVDTMAMSIRSLKERPSDSNDLHVFDALLTYLCTVRRTPDPTLVPSLLAHLPAPYDDMAQTTLDYIRAAAASEGEELGLKRGEELGLKRGEELGLKRGEELGRKRGEELGRRETALRLLAQNVPVDVISKATLFAPDELRRMAQQT